MSVSQYNNIIVSIRLMSGGHSFSPNAIMSLANGASYLKAEIITPKTTLVPSQMFDKSRATEYLAFVGIAPDNDEVVVCSDEVDGKVAVMAMSKDCYAQLSLAFGNNITFTSPLIQGHAPKQGALIDLVGDVLYVRVFNAQMLFGEAVEVIGDADLRYAIEKINHVYNIYNMHVRARGDVDRLVKCCDKKFKDLEIVA